MSDQKPEVSAVAKMENDIPKDAPVIQNTKEVKNDTKIPSVAELIPKVAVQNTVPTIIPVAVPAQASQVAMSLYSDDPDVNAAVIRIKEERERMLREASERKIREQAEAAARVFQLEEERKRIERERYVRDQAEIVINSERFDALSENEKNELYMDYYISAGNIQKFLSKYPYMHNLLGKYNIGQRSMDYRKRCEEEKQILARIQEEQRQRELQMERERIAMEVRRAEEERIRKERREKYEREINEVNREIQILEENLTRAKQRKAQVIADNM